jgi:hypothetical protein
MDSSQNWYQGQAIVNVVIKIQLPYKPEILLTISANNTHIHALFHS